MGEGELACIVGLSWLGVEEMKREPSAATDSQAHLHSCALKLLRCVTSIVASHPLPKRADAAALKAWQTINILKGIKMPKRVNQYFKNKRDENGAAQARV